MPANYSAYKPTTSDNQFATKINNFIDAVETDMNAKQDSLALWARQIYTATADYTVVSTDYTIQIDATVADTTITLPAAASFTGRILVFRRIDATAYRALVGSVYELFVQNEVVTLQSNGTAWVVIG